MVQKVLLVDDDPLVHQLYRPHLERAGFQVLEAENGLEALETVESEQPQLIVMDIIMAGLDGITALRVLKSSPTSQASPVIIITANVSLHHATRKEAFALGAAAFLSKPFSPAQLLAEIHRLIPEPRPEAQPAKQH